MRASTLVVVALTIVCVASQWNVASAQKGGCRDVATRWFIYPVATLPTLPPTTVAAAITGDGDWYSSSSGTSNTVIHVCGSDPTYDSTLLMSSRRKLSVAFPAPISGSVLQESVSGTYLNSAFINVRNLLCFGCATPPGQPFTTRMAFQLYGLANRSDYRLRFMPHATDAPDRHTLPEQIDAENTPFEGSPVTVLPQPYDCMTGGSTRPSWIVRATVPTSDAQVPAGQALQVGTLTRIGKPSIVHAGRYLDALRDAHRGTELFQLLKREGPGRAQLTLNQSRRADQGVSGRSNSFAGRKIL